ncbi:MAG: hypothetical protein Q7V53_04870, partial [Caldisericota bacterium]|nr:hypothetical protein [Caldisericota bacterium]
MALVSCHECNKELSSEAAACPHCGAPARATAPPGQKTNKNIVRYVWAALAVTIVVIYANSNTPEPRQKSTAELEADREKERQFQVAAAVIKSLKSSMKNPKSFELVSAQMMDGDTLCITYRGTNSFNAVVTNHYVVSTTVS